MFNKYGVPIDYTTGKDVSIQPKLDNKMRVRFQGFGNVTKMEHSFDVTQQIISVTRPGIEFTPIPIKVFRGTVNTINKPTYSAISVTLRDDLSNKLITAVDSQISKQYNFDTANTPISTGSAKFKMIIESLDGKERIRAMDAWHLSGCLISNIRYGENNYTGDNIVTVSFDVVYDHIEKHITERFGADEAKTVNYLQHSIGIGTDRA